MENRSKLVVELLPEENELLKELGDFSIDLNEDYEVRQARLNCSKQLATSLLNRNAIPKPRLGYFSDPKHNLSNPKKSRKQIFEDNGTKGDLMLKVKDPNFLKHLKYFIFGPNLPESLLLELYQIKAKTFYDDEFKEKALLFIRSYFKSSRFTAGALSDEIYKLCLDLEIEEGYAIQIRNSVMKFK